MRKVRKGKIIFAICSAICAMCLAKSFGVENGVEQKSQERLIEKNSEIKDPRDKSVDELLKEHIARERKKARFSDKITPEELMSYLIKRKWYNEHAFVEMEEATLRKKETTRHGDADLSQIKESARADINNIAVILGEIPASGQKGVFAPVFLLDRKGVLFGSSDFSLSWAGLKATMKLSQKKFPWEKTTLEETFIGSFLYASGTNLGFISSEFGENTKFYTNYISEIVTLKYNFIKNFNVCVSLDSRQYFFVKKTVPENFVMPLNHFNVFPRVDVNFSDLTEKGIDQITHGVGIFSWIGYGVRNRWEKWGTPPNYEMGEEARTFVIYSFTFIAGYAKDDDHNVVGRVRYKGGKDNDFLTRPRFGGTIDNARLDVVHGFTVDSFRVDAFFLVNTYYGFNLTKRLRLTLYVDGAHMFGEQKGDVGGVGIGLRVLAWGGLPVWFTYGIGAHLQPELRGPEQVVMLMSAAGW
ncbi:MAG: hypothetical protein N2316_00300 [Spirochaetes bacterium]|nr:hypothetical protein [Spirochaetota bacterium]